MLGFEAAWHATGAQDVERAADAFAKEKVKYGCPVDADSTLANGHDVNGDDGVPSSPTSPRGGKPPVERCPSLACFQIWPACQDCHVQGLYLRMSSSRCKARELKPCP